VFVAAVMCAAAAVCIGLFSLLTPSDPLLLNATLIFVIGLCIAAPDSVLGGVGVTDACEQAGAGEGVLSSASGLVVRQRSLTDCAVHKPTSDASGCTASLSLLARRRVSEDIYRYSCGSALVFMAGSLRRRMGWAASAPFSNPPSPAVYSLWVVGPVCSIPTLHFARWAPSH
jgi:hypothetical protein